MYAALRHYRVNAEVSEEVVRRVVEDFAPQLFEEAPGLLAYYVLDAQDGAFATVTLCESQETLEECSKKAADWVAQYLAESIRSKEYSNSVLVEVGPTLQGLLHHVAAPEAANNQSPQEATEFVENEEASEAPDSPSQELLSPTEVGRELGMGKSWVYQRIRSGQLPSIKLGHNIKIRRAELEEYLEKHHSRPSGG
jgi:excisionase family DNA binding protein